MAITLNDLEHGQNVEPPRILIFGPGGIGKALRNDMPVLMADGSWSPIGEIQVGQEVATPDGGAAPVLGVFPQGERWVYQITTDDAASVVCDGDHLWLTETTNERSNEGKTLAPSFYGNGRVRTTLQIKESIDTYGGKAGRLNHYLPLTEPTTGHDNWEAYRIEPYALGAILGDGHSPEDGGTSITTPDFDIIERICASGVQANHQEPYQDRTCSTWRLPELVPSMKEIGLYGHLAADKFIPEIYLRGNAEFRLALFQGLCDTDGHPAAPGIVEYCTVSKRLCEDMKLLAQSLGCVVFVYEKLPQYTYRGETRTGQLAYRMMIHVPETLAPFFCARKAVRWTPRAKYPVRRQIVSIEPAGMAECTCIYVGHPKHLFITKDYLVTHNTTWASMAPKPVFIFTEKGKGRLSVSNFPLATKWDDVREALEVLYREDHEFESVVIDSLDWLERLIWDQLCRENGFSNIEDFGYGKGYVKALSLWSEFLRLVNQLHERKNMIVILVGHSIVKTFNSPTTENFDQYRLHLHEKAAALLKEWADCVFFANYEIKVRKSEDGFGKSKGKAVTNGSEIPRLMHTVERPAYWAKNRYSLPDTLPLSWDAFEEAMAAGIDNNQ